MLKNMGKILSARIVLGLISVIFFSGVCFAENQVGWLSGWSHRRAIILHNYFKSELSDYPVKIKNSIIDDKERPGADDDKAKPDYADVRFTDSDGTTLLEYYLEDENNFWVKVPRLKMGINHPIFMYYGNNSARSLSNGKAVFDFFEDFQDQTLSQWQNNGWIISSSGPDGEKLAPRVAYSAFSKIKNAKLERTLSLPSADMRIEIYGAINGDLLQNYLIFYEENKKKIIWDETGGWVSKGVDLSSANPALKFLLKTDGEHTGGIDTIFVHQHVEPGVSVDFYGEASR